jgi:hypothetical protein
LEESKLIDYPGEIYRFIFDGIKSLGGFSRLLWSFLTILFIVSLCFFVYISFIKNLDKEKKSFGNSLCNSSYLFLFVISLGILILRIPTLGVSEINVDESEWIAGAATLMKDFRFWHSVNGTTSGPLNIVPLCHINLFGFGLNYSIVRLCSLIFIVIPTVILTFKSLKIISNENIAKLMIVPVFVFFAIGEHMDITAFNSEHFPMLFISLIIYFFIKGNFIVVDADRKFHINLLLCGIITGLLPYFKMQAAPIEIAFIIIFIANNHTRKKYAFADDLIFISGILVPNLIVLIYILQFNLVNEFLNYFILNNLDYSSTGFVNSSPTWYLQNFEIVNTWYEKPLIVPRIIFESKDLILFYGLLAGISVFSLSILMKKFKDISRKYKETILYLLLIFIFAYISIIIPGNVFVHYIIFLIIPSCLLSGVLFGLAFETSQFDKLKFSRYLKYSLCLFIIIPVLIFALDGNCYIKSILKNDSSENISNVSLILKKFSHSNDKLAVWGYMNNFYVEAGLIQGTREPMTRLQITNTSKQEYYLNNYCKDIEENKPVLFVDAVGEKSFFYKDYVQRHENYPAVKKLVNENYNFIDSVDNVRIYTRKK